MEHLQEGIDGLEQFSGEDMRKSRIQGLDLEALLGAGFSTRDVVLKTDDFNAYLAEVDYPTNYPFYVERFSQTYIKSGKSATWINRKFLEQYVSIQLTGPGPGHSAVDIAAANGPFSSILASRCEVGKSIHQDLNAPHRRLQEYKGWDRVTDIQCNAAGLPFEDSSIDKMYLLNSWEHFQAPSDVDFLIEAERCLTPGGQVLIVPLNAARQAFVMTDLSVWDRKQVYDADKEPLFRPDVPVVLTKTGQVYAQDHDADLLIAFAKRTPKLSYEIVRISLDQPQEWFSTNTWNVLLATKS